MNLVDASGYLIDLIPLLHCFVVHQTNAALIVYFRKLQLTESSFANAEIMAKNPI